MTESLVNVSHHGRVCQIELNRVAKLNAASRALLHELAAAFRGAEDNPEVRAVVVSAAGAHFTSGLDLADVLGPAIAAEAPHETDRPHEAAPPAGLSLIPEGLIDPWGISTEPLSKPVIVAVQGLCYTLGVELILASDIAVAADDTVFGQIEVSRGILPFGGATVRFPARVGWGNAMRWLLTGDTFDAAEGLRIGLVQEVVPAGQQVERALELAQRVAAMAPLAVAATLRNARRASAGDPEGAVAQLRPELSALLGTNDFAAGVAAFHTKTSPEFEGR
jgi:enoyl-CoA hydratase